MNELDGILKKKFSKIILFVILDIIILILTSVVAIGLRFDFKEIPNNYLINSYKYIVLDIVLMISIFTILKLYTSVWKYASIVELINVFIGCFATEFTIYFYKSVFGIQMPRSYYLIQLMLLILCIGGIRFSFRILRTLIIKYASKKNKEHTMIIGAGNAGRLLIDEIVRNYNDFNTRIVCIIDDNKEKLGTYIHGIPIVGTCQDIENQAKKYNIKDIIIAMPSVGKETISRIVTECQKTTCNVKILPSIYLTMNENNKEIISNIRSISYEDFLGRDQIIVNLNEISNNIKDKRIMVTGGGGSIGSELCRQIAKCDPKQLIIFDVYENNAYEIQQELLRDYPMLDLRVIIGSVRDYDRLEKVFKEYEPEQVFHAAAHKHVPLMEASPNEAIKNNCLGTLNCVKLADKYKTNKFVLISTDKAVRPTNIMGASKRICEMIIQTYNNISKNTDYVAVRFGNVLGSNGSVIPLFLKQIENGGPVTVTHKEITRFFMTIPEAVSLVLQASVYANGGEIFVLDMGKPVKIYELAEKLIKYKGHTPNEDIKIEITGLRPGEKLYEEILMEEEGLKETSNNLIHIGKPLEISDNFLTDLKEIIKCAYNNDNDIKEKVAKIVPTYKVDYKMNYEIKPFKKRVWLSSPTMHGEEIKYVTEAYETNWMSTVGKNIDEVEKITCEKMGCKYAVALSGGTASLHLAMKLAGVKSGEKVFCSDMTFAATVNPVVYEGGIPVFIDTEYETWNMDPVALEKAFEIYPDVKVVVLVHLYGTPAKIDEIKKICEKYNAILIEDAAESMGATYKNKKTGTFGAYNCISFNGNKIITGSSGGMLLTDDINSANKARKLSTQARENAPWYEHEEIGYNYRMSNVIAGVVRGQYPHLEEHISQKKAIYERYKEGFKDLPVKMNPYDEKNSEPNFWLSCMIIDKDSMCRQVRSDKDTLYVSEKDKSCPTEILETLAKYNAEGRPIWKPMHMQPVYRANPFVTRDGNGRASTNAYISSKENDVGMDIFERGLCLPSDNKMTVEEQDKIIEIIKQCFKSYKE